MKTIISLLILLTGNQLFSQTVFISDLVEKLWATSEGLKTPESVLYDAARNVCYVSNMADYTGEKGNDGFISIISLEGKILNLNWITELKDPKGMGIIGNNLYVADVTNIIEIDIPSGMISRAYAVENAKFLNDISVTPDGKVFVSDSKDQAVYLLQNDRVELFVKSDKLKGINGLWVGKNKLLAGANGMIVSIDLDTKSISDYILNTGGIDGLVADGKGNYLISDWQGNVYRAYKSKEKETLIDTTPAKINAADIDYIIKMSYLLVPTFNDNRVVCYKIKN